MKRLSPPKAPTRTSKSDGEGILSRILPVDEVTTGIKLNVYGRGKTGKTRLACTFPKPLLLMGTEDGTHSVRTVKGVDFIRLQTPGDLEELVPFIRERYKTAVLDTAGGFQDLILKEVVGLEDVPVSKTWGLVQQREWGMIGSQFKERMTKLFRLADEENINIVVIAHERNFTAEDVPADIMLPSIGSALSPGSATWLNGACDFVCQAFIREQTITKEVEAVKGKKTTVREKTGKEEFCLRVGPHPVFTTGFRLPPGRTLPDVIVDPTYEKVSALIRGVK